MAKIDDLKIDVGVLEKCIAGIAAEITALQSGKSPDFSLIAKKLKDKGEAEKFLEEKITELEKEEYKEQNRPADEEQKKAKKEFDRKSNSYSVVRNSYVKPADN